MKTLFFKDKNLSFFRKIYPNILFGMFLTLLFFSSCKQEDKNDLKIQAKGEKPEWRTELTSEMRDVIDKLESFGTPPLITLSVEEARKAPTPADAAKAVMEEKNIPVPPSMVDTAGKDIPVEGGNIHIRIYTPKASGGPFPVVVYYHGGGWVIANLDTYDASARGLAEQVEAIVVSVAYRQAPEYKFPTAHNDSYAAYKWVLNNAQSINGLSKKVAVAGESAGGNLAIAVSLMAREEGIQLPVHELSVYPIACHDFNTESYKKYADAKPLNKPLMMWFFNHYVPNKEERNSPFISLINADLKGLPGTTIIAAEIDPLLSEGMSLASKLEKAKVPVKYKLYKGVTHEFFGMAAVVPEAKEAQEFASAELRKAFDKVN